MAWNEPGGNNKDPWGGGNNNQGPPDLDEALKKLQEKLNGMFGGGRSGGGKSGMPAAPSGNLLIILLAVVALFWAGAGIYQVDEKERAVILRLGKFHDIKGPGLHWYPPLIDVKTVVRTTEERSYESRGLMLTKDETIVELPLTVQFNIADPKAFVLNVRNPLVSLQHATDSALRHVVGSTRLNDILSVGRGKLADDVKVRLQQYLDAYGTGILVVNTNIQEARPPNEVKAAYDDVIKAREDQERLVNEAQAYANGIIPEARGMAQRMIEEAEAYRAQVELRATGEAERFQDLLAEYTRAPEVTRERLYLDAVQEVMVNSSKVLVDVRNGNNMIYLPLDRLQQQSSGGATSRNQSFSDRNIGDIADEVLRRLRSEPVNTRGGR